MTEMIRDTQLSAAESAVIAQRGLPNALKHWRRQSWMIALADRYQIALANETSRRVRRTMAFDLLPDLFLNWRHSAYIDDTTDRALAITALGPDIRHVRIGFDWGGEAGLRVAATSRPEAVSICKSLGLEPLVA